MTFEHEGSIETSATPAAVWALWSDIHTWSTWDPPVERVVLDGPFRVGTTGTMTLAGGIEAPFELREVRAEERYLDRLTLGELVIDIDHRVEPREGGSLIRVRTVIDGPGADQIGPMVTAEAPAALAALVAMAEAAAPVS